MKTYTLPVIGIMTLGAAAFANTTPSAASTGDVLLAPDSFSTCKWLGDRFKWFNAERDHKNPYIQEFNVSLRMQYGMDWIDPNGEGRVMGEREGNGRRFNDEWRRFRAGFNMKFLKNFKLTNVWNIGGMDGLESYNAAENRWDTTDLTYSLYELNLEYKGGPVTYALGKMKPRITGEYRTSSSAILTIERSMLVNQLRSETNYGFQVNNSNKNDKLGWAAGIWMNGNGGTGTGSFNNRIEPAFNSQDNCFVTGTLSYDTSNDVFLKKSRLWLDYAHNFTKWGDDAQNKAYDKLHNYSFKSKYQGTGAKDVVALTWEGSQGDFSLMTEVMAGFNVIGMKAGAENVFGVTIMPSYKFTPNWEGVLRYQMAAGSNAVKWEKRYTQNSTYSGTSDCMQALYLGVNYYIFECNPNMAKIMAGIEYAHSNGTDASKQKGFTGWSYNIAFRTNF